MATMKQIKVINTDDPAGFQEQVNRAMQELHDKDPELTIKVEGGEFTAVIQYLDRVQEEPQTVKEEYHRDGIRFVCSQCPYVEIPFDGRVRWCHCRYAIGNMTHKDHECCERFYQELAQGMIKPRY